MSHLNRVVVLVDMDCFYCQVEEQLDPNIAGKPIAVVQYNAWKGGGIIAVNYPARDRGVTRHMRGNEAKEKCPEIELVRVPNVRGKADLSKYREAGKRVADILQTFTHLLERASVDEAYLDITEAVNQRINDKYHITADKLKTSHVVSHASVDDFLNNLHQGEFSNEHDMKLAIGGSIAEEVRAAVFEKTGYRCSAGIAHNKILAKLVCGLHKPNQQTILPHEGIPELFENMPVKKITGLGGKFGVILTEKLNIQKMGELRKFTEKELTECVDKKNASWLYNLARGIDLEPVTARLVSKSIGCCKKFPNRTALMNEKSIKHWLKEFATEIFERLENDSKENGRIAKQMVVNFAQVVNRKAVSSSKSTSLNAKDVNKIALDAYEVVKKQCIKPDGSFHVTFLGISVGKFEDIRTECDISTFFKNCTSSGVGNSGKARVCDIFEQNPLKNEQSSISMLFKTMEKNKPSNNEKAIQQKFEDEVKINKENVESTENDYESDDSISAELTNNEKKIAGIEMPKSPVMRDFDTSINLGKNSSDSIDQSEDSVNSNDLENNSNGLEINANGLENNSNGLENNSNGLENNSKSLENNSKSLENNSKSLETNSRGLENNIDVFPSTSDFNEPKQMCVECKTLILKTEMVSHLDHHFALKMVKDESLMYKPKVIPQDSKKSISLKKSAKRKSSENCSKLTPFLVAKTDSPNDIPSEICAECHKKIPLREFGNHLDFHEAQSNKKLIDSNKKISDGNKKINVSNKKIIDSNKKITNGNKKRKIVETKNSSKLTKFLVKDVEETNDTTKCTECNRHITIEDFASHMDHHIAKKLHLEINPVQLLQNTQVVKPNNNPKSISSFFKPI